MSAEKAGDHDYIPGGKDVKVVEQRAEDVSRGANTENDSSNGKSRASTLQGSSSGDEKAITKDENEFKEKLPEGIKIGESTEEEKQDALEHLPEHERNIIKRQLEIPNNKVGARTLYRYASKNDLIIIVVSSICAIAAGAALPLMTVIFGQLAGIFKKFILGVYSGAEFDAQVSHFALYFIYLAIAEFLTTYTATVGFIYSGEHITQKIREHYLAAILRQNIGFFDKLGAGEITTRITSDTNLVQDGISEKVGLTLTALATFITAFVIGFVKNAKLTGILFCTVIAISLTMGTGSRWIVTWNKKALNSYAAGGTVAEEVISSIRNATAFNTQEKLARQYEEHLKDAQKWGLRHKGLLGIMLGFMMFFLYLNYGLAFWQGSRFLVDPSEGVTLSDILTILLAVMIGAFSLGNVAPNVQAFTTGVAAAAKIFNTIDRTSPIDPTNDEGQKLEHVDGNVELQHIRHIYPSRPEVVVMEDINLIIPASKTTALVGSSGCGKSTIVGLVERFYDPVGGLVLLDGYDVRDLNLRSLRQHISLVSQEPILFSTSIFGNIAHGLIGTEFEGYSNEKKKNLVEDAAKMANAHDFIVGLPEGYETQVGERGFLLSGGQKQRIAIARAVVSDPKILLLDEATSALDTRSEGVVQAALDKAAKGRTTIMIAHRLSTIKHADNIVVMAEGKIVEQGTHDELLEQKGNYYNLVEAQRIAAKQPKELEEVETVEQEEEEEDEAIATPKDLSRTQSRDSVANKNNLIRTTTSKSISGQILKGQESETKPHYSLWTLIKVVASFNRQEWGLMILGLLSSIIAGSGHPVQAVFFAECITALTKPPSEYNILRSDIDFWSLMYLMLAFALLIGFVGQGVAFAVCSERLVYRARNQAFRAMLRQDIAFFDKEENSPGALTSFLSTQTTHLAGLSGSTLGTILTVLTTLIAAFSLSLAVGWKLALVCISIVPVLLGSGFLRFFLLVRFQTRSKKAYEKSASYASEAVSGIRTVASLSREHDVWEQYHGQLVLQRQKSFVSILKSSTLYAAAQSIMFLSFALGFWYGSRLLAQGEYSITRFFIIFSSVIFGAQAAGTIFSFAPDMGKAKHAASELKRLFDRQPLIDSWSDEGDRLEQVQGHVVFSDVHFRYPTRPEQPVLRGLNLTVKPGEYIALVGPSGCGKSTTISLLERFYDTLSGKITLDGHEISSLNINSYRSHLALVSQEPTLYQGTIRENILLGADRSDVSESEIERACKDANIYNFVISLPDGFETVVGNKGVMLSGGQKQRIAIARALIRDPKVLLLDEATSALDSESEKVVQAALDYASKGRTTIAVAHRLSTIQGADCIFVFENGVIVEQGKHAELMRKKGRYFELVQLQSLEKMG